MDARNVPREPTVDAMLPRCEWVERASLSHRYAHCRCRCRSHRPAYGPCCYCLPVVDAIRGQAAKVCRLAVCLPVLPCGPARVGGLLWRDACDTRHLLNAEVAKSTAITSMSKSKSTECEMPHHVSIPWPLPQRPPPVDAALLHTSAFPSPEGLAAESRGIVRRFTHEAGEEGSFVHSCASGYLNLGYGYTGLV